jgi:hypothetical protein
MANIFFAENLKKTNTREVFATTVSFGNQTSKSSMKAAFKPIISLSLALPCCFGCPNKCSQNGTCTPLGICSCNSGFTGGDCSIRTCPSGIALDMTHKNLPCSGRGTCVNGNCVCSAGFTGSACERSKLDKVSRTCLQSENTTSHHFVVNTTAKCFRNCSNNGRCVSMRHLAETTRNHESQQYSYNQWDADQIYGCICDLGFQG